MLNIIEKRKTFFTLSGLLFIASVLVIATLGFKLGIDFTGGSLLEVSFTGERPAISEVRETVETFGLEGAVVQTSGDDGMIVKTKFLSETEHQDLLEALREKFGESTDAADVSGLQVISEDGTESAVEATFEIDGVGASTGVGVIQDRFETIGPTVSSQLRSRSIQAGIAVIIAIIIYVAYAFRKVSKPVASWKYGLTAIIALVHDVTISLGVLALLGHYLGVEITIAIVVALLTILGYSVNDTIVVFDRVRENLIKKGSSDFSGTVNTGVNQTIVRSLNTSITTLVVLFALFMFGGDSIRYFALTLMIGIVLGTYSSIFLASPLLVVWQKLKK